jgi:hypothetical protein
VTTSSTATPAPNRLDELDEMARAAQERAAKATPGPWSAKERPDDGCPGEHLVLYPNGEDVPALAAALQAATAEIRRLWAEATRPTPRSPEDEEAMGIIRRAAEALRQRQEAADEAEVALYAARLALAEPDEEGDCRRCLRTMTRPDRSEGEEATPLCAACAQALLPTLAAEVLRLREQPATPDDLATIEAAASEDKAVASRATARPWRWWTANSMRELRSEAGRRHEVVAYGFRAHDGVNDISIGETDMRLIERAVNGLEQRADALLRLAGEVRRLREALERQEAHAERLASDVSMLRSRDVDWQQSTGCCNPEDATPVYKRAAPASEEQP